MQSIRDRLRNSSVFICTSAGVFGTLLGFALFVFWEEKLEEPFTLFMTSLVLAMLMAWGGEWILEQVQGGHRQHQPTLESRTDFLTRTLLYLLFLAVLEISVMAAHALAKHPADYAKLLGKYSIGTGPSDKLWYLIPQVGLWLVIGGMLGWCLATEFAKASRDQQYSVVYCAKIGAVAGSLYVFVTVFCYGLLVRAFGVIAWIRSNPDAWKSALEAEKGDFDQDFVSRLLGALVIFAKRLAGWLVSGDPWNILVIGLLLLGLGYVWWKRWASFSRILKGVLISLAVIVVLLVIRDFDDLVVRGLVGGLFAVYLWFLPAVFLCLFFPLLEALSAADLEEVPPALRFVVSRLRQLDHVLAPWVPVAIIASITFFGLSILFSSYWALALALLLLAVVSLTRPPEKIRNYWPIFALLVFYVLGAVTTLGQTASFFSIQAQMRLINQPTPSIRVEETRFWFPDLYKELFWAELMTPPKNIEALLALIQTNRAKLQEQERGVEDAKKAARGGDPNDLAPEWFTSELASPEIEARKKINDLIEFELWVQLDLAKVSTGQHEYDKVLDLAGELHKENLQRIAAELEGLTPTNRELVWKMVNDNISDPATVGARLRTLKRTTANEVLTVDFLVYQLPGLISHKVLLESRIAELSAKCHSGHADSTGPARLQLAIVVSVGFWLTVSLLVASSLMKHRNVSG